MKNSANNIGIIDCGTNTFNLLIAKKELPYKEIYSDKIPVYLAEASDSLKRLSPEAFARAIEALKVFKSKIMEMQVREVKLLATSAIRDAENGFKLLIEVKRIIGYDIQVIDGNKEAELIYLGVRNSFAMDENNSLIMDIGGGSTEFIIANKNKILWKKSYQLGVSRLMELFKPHDPMQNEGIVQLERYLWDELQSLKKAMEKYPCKSLIGSSGSFETLADMIYLETTNKSIFDQANIFRKVDPEAFYLLHSKLLLSDIDERRKMKGMLEMRVKMIVISSIFVNLVLKKFNIQQFYMSDYSLKEGAFFELINSN